MIVGSYQKALPWRDLSAAQSLPGFFLHLKWSCPCIYVSSCTFASQNRKIPKTVITRSFSPTNFLSFVSPPNQSFFEDLKSKISRLFSLQCHYRLHCSFHLLLKRRSRSPLSPSAPLAQKRGLASVSCIYHEGIPGVHPWHVSLQIPNQALI